MIGNQDCSNIFQEIAVNEKSQIYSRILKFTQDFPNSSWGKILRVPLANNIHIFFIL